MEPDARRVTPPVTDWHMLFDPWYVDAQESWVPFLTAARSLAESATTIADIGCGRGGQSVFAHDGVTPQDLRGQGRTVIGIDIDAIGVENTMIDEFRRIGADGTWPIEDASVDLAVSDWTLEHVADPSAFVAELTRVLRPGGVFVARTISRYSALSVAARAVPNHRHAQVLARLQPGRDAKDVFPTEYRMNSRRALAQLFDGAYDWAVSHRSDLRQYFHPWPRTARAINAVEPRLPRQLRSTLVITARKR